VQGGIKMSQYSILWFSGTGNTLLCARALAAALAEGGAETELIDIVAAAYWQPPAETTLIFCWPVYCFGPPRLVRKFIKQMLPGANRVYQLCTLGGDGGGAMRLTARLLRSKGYQVCGGTEILMPNNFTGGRIPDAGSIQDLVAAAKVKSGEFAQYVLKGEHVIQSVSVADPVTVGGLNWGFRLIQPLLGRMFKLSKEKCTGCAICVRTCPVDNIAFDSLPRWGKDCELCLRCLHICPQAAIDYMGALKKGRPQYMAPETDFTKTR
jgi:NAD-dependent dihydropyrimidine dehydrogenase PreA subunit/flavodoxin